MNELEFYYEKLIVLVDNDFDEDDEFEEDDDAFETDEFAVEEDDDEVEVGWVEELDL